MTIGISSSNLPNWSQVQNDRQANQRSEILAQFSPEINAPTRQNEDVYTSIRARETQARSELYQGINEGLQTARETGTQAANFGNTLVDGLSELRDLATQFSRAENDETRNALSEQFRERASALGELVSENQPTNTISAALRSGGSTNLSVNLTESRFDFSGISSLSIDNAGGLDAQLTTATRFTATAENFNRIADRQMRINETLFAPGAAQGSNSGQSSGATTNATPETPVAEEEEADSEGQTIEEMREFVQGINASIIQQTMDAFESQANVQQNAASWLFAS